MKFLKFLRRFKCIARGAHDPVKQPVGGFRCVDCGRPGVDFCVMRGIR